MVNPKGGTWTLRLQIIVPGIALNIASEGALSDAEITDKKIIAAQQNANEFLPPHLIHGSLRSDVTMDVFTDTGPVKNATVNAEVTRPNGGTITVKLFDDGNHGDGNANDGVYSN